MPEMSEPVFELPVVRRKVLLVEPNPPPPRRPLTEQEEHLLAARRKVEALRKQVQKEEDYRSSVQQGKLVRRRPPSPISPCQSAALPPISHQVLLSGSICGCVVAVAHRVFF